MMVNNAYNDEVIMIAIMMVITKHQLYQLMWVNQCHVYHFAVITMFIGGINYYSQMGG